MTANKAIKLWFYSALAWLVIGPAISVFQSIQFLIPDWMNFLSTVRLSYGKLRIIHTNTTIYGGIVMSFIAMVVVSRFITLSISRFILRDRGVVFPD